MELFSLYALAAVFFIALAWMQVNKYSNDD